MGETTGGDAPIVLRDWGHMPLADRAEGIYIWDEDGKRYIDGSGGSAVVTNVGHGIQTITEAMYSQGKKLSYPPAHAFGNRPALDLARRIAAIAPLGLKNNCRTWLGTTGTDAVDSALRLARSYFVERGEGSRYLVIARWQSFHGNSIALAGVHGLTARRRLYQPMFVSGPHIPPAYCYRCYFDKGYPGCDLACARALEREICQQGPENVAAFIAEPVVGASLAAVPAPPGYFERVREICDKYGILFIADEVMTGWGRTGTTWGIENWGVTPDIVATAKGMSSGYAPIAATIGRDALWATLEASGSPFRAGHTMNYNPVSCASALANLDYLIDHKLSDNAAEVGGYLLAELRTLLEYKSVGDARGLGLMAGFELVQNKETKEPFPPSLRLSRQIERATMERGLVVYPCNGSVDGVAGDMILLAPPLVITRAQVDEMIAIIRESLTVVEKAIGLN